MSIVHLSVPADRVESDAFVCGAGACDPAHQTLRLFAADGACTLIVNLVWPRGVQTCGAVTVLSDPRHAGEGD